MSMLSSENEAYIEAQIASGQFVSREAILDRAITVLRSLEADRQWVIREVQRGIEQANQGQYMDFDADDIKSRGRERLAREPGAG